jgi:FAD dependent monooxygenase
MSKESHSRFRVIVVGGSVAGLTLAHALDSAGIEYILLEGRDVAPAAGASIVLMPNGTRILDQLGLYKQAKELQEPMLSSTTWRSDGRFVSRNEWPKLIGER